MCGSFSSYLYIFSILAPLGSVQEQCNTVQPQRQRQVPVGFPLRNDGKEGLHQEKDRAKLKQERQNIQASRFFQNASANSSTTAATYNP